MSLVGTRPILPDELEQYELHHRARIAIKPGITGMWQVSGRSDITDFEEIVRLDFHDKEYSFQLPEHIAESWIEYSEYEIKRKKEVIESTEKPVSNMIVYYRRNEKPVIKMLSIDEDKLQEARKKLDETTKKRES